MIQFLESIVTKPARLAVGLMSGTSLDGIDAAVVRLKGCGSGTEVELLHFTTLPFTTQEREAIMNLCAVSTSKVDDICAMNVYLGERFAQAAILVVQAAGLDMAHIDFISSHGQTIHHMPASLATLQIGELSVIAARTGCLTVGDFRPSDMAMGGQGAPLVPYVDYLLFGSKQKGRVLLNIGGIANITVLSADTSPEGVIAFDTGPGNVLIDAVTSIGTGGLERMDRDGQLAQQGKPCQQLLESWLKRDLFIGASPPKSTGRELYTLSYAQTLYDEGEARGLSFPDIVATVTAYTVDSIELHFQEFIDQAYQISEVYVGGGGVHNPVLMANLRAKLQREVLSMESLGFPSAAKEAVAFAVLGNEFLMGRTNNLPSATGASRPVRMGKLALP